MNLQTRKRLAAPFYWLAGVFLTWANRIDGPQPRKAKTAKEISKAIYSAPGASKDELLDAFGAIKPRKRK